MSCHKPDLKTVWTHSLPRAPGQVRESYLTAKYHHFIYIYYFWSLNLLILSITYALQLGRSVQFSRWTLKVVGVPLMMLLHFFSLFLCLPLPWVNIQSPDCHPFVLAPFTTLCRIVFDVQDYLAMWPYHLRFCILIIARRSWSIPIESWFLLRTSSFITWSL